ncbi:MAG: LptA/OstA family protein [Planctomycetota bacterium]
MEASDETGRLEAEGLELAFDTEGGQRQLRKMTARGNARYRQEKPYRVAQAETIEYTPKEGTLDLAGGERGLASVEEEAEVIEAEALRLEGEDGSQRLTGKGVGRLQYYEGVVDPRARETSRPAYDIRWKQRCSLTEKRAVFEGEVEALQARSRLRSNVLELGFEAAPGGKASRAPRTLAARGGVVFDDLSRGESLQAKGDILTFDFSTQVMKLESTAEYDEEARNLPEGAVASITFGPNRLSSRTVYYLEDKDTSERLLWTQRGGEADIQRFERRGQREELVERTRVRCRGSIVYAPPRRLEEAAKRAGMPFGKTPMPEGLVAAPTKDVTEDGLALFVDDVRVRREVAPRAGGKLEVELELACRYLETHFGKEKGSNREQMTRMGAAGRVQITHKKRHKETVATGERMTWERDDQREWRAELLGAPYARVEDEDKQLTGKRVMLYGNPAEVKVEEAVSVSGSAP